MKLKFLSILIIYLFFNTLAIYCQGSAGSNAKYDSRYIVDMPTAGVLPKGTYSIYGIVMADGGLMAELDVAPFESFYMGISFSGSNIIGDREVKWQNLPGVNIRVRIFDERIYSPAVLLGFSSQGRGLYLNDYDRFETISPGLFLSLSKDFIWDLGNVATHFGLNYSIEPPNKDRALNFYFGIEHSLFKTGSINIEYNANLDDSNKEILKNKGLLNIAFRLSVAKGLTFELQARDLLGNISNSTGFTRFLGIEYISNF